MGRGGDVGAISERPQGAHGEGGVGGGVCTVRTSEEVVGGEAGAEVVDRWEEEEEGGGGTREGDK